MFEGKRGHFLLNELGTHVGVINACLTFNLATVFKQYLVINQIMDAILPK